jgi:uncharacterized protein YerC
MYWNLSDKERLIKSFVIADTTHLVRDFLKELMTEKEIDSFVKKLKAACMLYDAVPYSHIQQVTGLSSATIAQISKKLADKDSGFQQIIKKFNPHGRRYFE